MHTFTKIGQEKIRKRLPGLMDLDFCCNIWIVGSEFDVNNMKAWIHPAWYQWFRLVLVGYFSSWHTLAPLVLVKGCLNSTAWVMLLTMSVLLWLQCKYLVMATSSRIMCHLQKLKSSQPDFLNKMMCSLDSNGLHSHQISIKLSTFGMQQQHDDIMSIWTKISEECFQHLVECQACSEELRQFWRQKAVQPGNSKVIWCPGNYP